MGWDGPMTDRQFQGWNAWLLLQWNRPSRSDHYAMSIATEVRRSYVAEPKKVVMADMRVPFLSQEEAARQRQQEATAKDGKAPSDGPRVATKEDVARHHQYRQLAEAGMLAEAQKLAEKHRGDRR